MQEEIVSKDQLSKIESIIGAFKSVPGALMPLLHEIQNEMGYIPESTYPSISRELNLSVAEVHGVVTFYHHFRTHRPGKHILQICRAESCQSMGCGELETHVKCSLGVDYHETTSDGEISLEPVYCLGNCALSPAVMMDDQIYGRVNVKRIDEIIESVKEKV